jgi:predicted phage terminase large subunit-like protein
MSSTPTPTADSLHRLAREQPLVSPLVASVALFDYEHAPPAHVREIYGDSRRALSDDYPRAPKKLVKIEPREHAKSEAGAVVVPTWAILQNPNRRVLLMSETEQQAKDKLREIADHAERLAPRFGRQITTNSTTEFQLEREASHDVPTVRAAGFQTGVTGGHYDLLVFDDLVSYESQRTPGRREKAWSMFQDYLNLGSEGESVFLVLGTRKHPKDLYNHLLQAPVWQSTVERAIHDWSVVSDGAYHVTVRDDQTGQERRVDAGELQMINGETETIVDVHPHRDVDVLWPERWPLDTLLLDLLTGYGAEASTLVWRRENQNKADVFEGEVLAADMLEWAPLADVPDSGLQWRAGLDLAVESDPEAAARGDTDYWALATLAHHARTDRTYVMDLARTRGLTLQAGVNWVADVVDDRVGRILVEDNQAQRWFVQSARDAGLDVEPTTSSGAKEDRIIDMASQFESGRLQLAEDAQSSWESFVAEWCAFPTGDHDDRLDAVEIALRGVSTGAPVQRSGSMSDLF